MKYAWEKDSEIVGILEAANEHISYSDTGSNFAIIGIVVANMSSVEAAVIRTDLEAQIDVTQSIDLWSDALGDVQRVAEEKRQILAAEFSPKTIN